MNDTDLIVRRFRKLAVLFAAADPCPVHQPGSVPAGELQWQSHEDQAADVFLVAFDAGLLADLPPGATELVAWFRDDGPFPYLRLPRATPPHRTRVNLWRYVVGMETAAPERHWRGVLPDYSPMFRTGDRTLGKADLWEHDALHHALRARGLDQRERAQDACLTLAGIIEREGLDHLNPLSAKSPSGSTVNEAGIADIKAWGKQPTTMPVESDMHGKSTPHPDLVTLDQAAGIVHRSKKTLEKHLKNMPLPYIQGGGGKPSLWKWHEIRPWLEKEYVPDLPKRFPGNIS
jgi:hypothetical protein